MSKDIYIYFEKKNNNSSLLSGVREAFEQSARVSIHARPKGAPHDSNNVRCIIL